MLSTWMSGFADELDKIAATRISEEGMREFVRRSRSPTDLQVVLNDSGLKRLYRNVSQQSLADEIPLPTRLENYKIWKQTGNIKPLNPDNTIKTQHPGHRYEYSNEPVTMYSGGGPGLEEAPLRQTVNLDNNRLLVPGQTAATRHGLWLSPSSQYAARFMRRDNPQMLITETLPRKAVVGNGQSSNEYMLPNTTGHLMPKPDTEVRRYRLSGAQDIAYGADPQSVRPSRTSYSFWRYALDPPNAQP